MLGLPLSFAAPLALAALAALPVIWIILRVTPPRPRRIDFPPLRIFFDLLPKRETPARTPWWLLALRLLLAAIIILAVAGPVWNPLAPGGTGGPLLLVVDNGFPAARDWRERQELALARVEAAAREGRTVAFLATAERAAEISAQPPAAVLERLRAVRPQPHLADRSVHLAAIGKFLNETKDAEIAWLSDGVAGTEAAGFAAELGRLAEGRAVTVHRRDVAEGFAIAGVEASAGALVAKVLRAEAGPRSEGTLRALDLRGLALADHAFTFAPGATEAEARFELPIELRNAVARIEVIGEGSAGAVTLLDERGKRRRVGLVFGGTSDQAQPLLAPTYYLSRALAPYAEVREGRGAIADAVSQLLDEQVSVLALADVGALDRQTLAKVAAFVDKGGMLLRFAGSRLAAGNDELVPVRLRRGGRALGGALSWETPRTFAPFTRESPYFGLELPADIGVRRQILAEPDGDLSEKTWAALEDGTPIVTATRRGEGLLVLFHVTADTTWSNLPLSGLFVDMLRRTVALAGAPDDARRQANAEGAPQTVPPRLVLDGFGAFVSPPPSARAVAMGYSGRASADHPPGFYGPVDASLAINPLTPEDRLRPLDMTGLSANVAPLSSGPSVDLRAPLLVAALLLFLADTLASLWLSGHLGSAGGGLRRPAAAASAVALVTLLAWPTPGFSQAAPSANTSRPLALSREAIQPALTTRLAYVITGDAQVDAASKAGLVGLTNILETRTALVPGEPVGIDLARDELAFYPLIYWPMVSGGATPSEAAIRRLDGFMKGGGTVVFDTRDAMNARPDGGPTPESQQLRRILGTLDIPELEPVPRDHVLTKTFYLLDNFPGRYATGQTWVEALPPASETERRPARAGDGVTPIVITSNDLAAAWAIGRRGEALYPLSGSDPRQREMSYRAGVNLVMYALTGNYKADQVHVPALLERLGQ